MDQNNIGVSGASQPQNIQDQNVLNPNSAGNLNNAGFNNQIPYERFQQVNTNWRQTQAENEQLKRRLAELEQTSYQQNTSPANDDAETAYVRAKYRIPDEAKIREEAKLEAQRAAEEAARRIAQEEIERQRRDGQIMDQVLQLEKEFDGSDGVIPKFNRDEVLVWGANHNIFDPRVAFEQMNKDQFKAKYAREYKEADKSTYVEAPSQATASMEPITAEEFAKLSLEEMDKRLGYAQ